MPEINGKINTFFAKNQVKIPKLSDLSAAFPPKYLQILANIGRMNAVCSISGVSEPTPRI